MSESAAQDRDRREALDHGHHSPFEPVAGCSRCQAPSAAHTPLRWPWFATFRSEGFFGVRVRRLYITLRSPEHKPLFSERNRIKCRTLHLPGTDWRIVARWDRAV